MSKELFVTSTPHETKLAVVEDDQVVEVFFERENEYTLAGSIYKGRVTRVLPGMQSAFVDIGLERDAFLYVTDFLEEVEDQDDLDVVLPAKGANEQRSEEHSEQPSRKRSEHRGRRSEQQRAASAAALQRPSADADVADADAGAVGSANPNLQFPRKQRPATNMKTPSPMIPTSTNTSSRSLRL